MLFISKLSINSSLTKTPWRFRLAQSQLFEDIFGDSGSSQCERSMCGSLNARLDLGSVDGTDKEQVLIPL